MKNQKRSIFLTLGTLLSLAYVVYAFVLFFKPDIDGISIFVSMLGVILAPHIIALTIGAVFNILGFLEIKPSFILRSIILYTAALVLFYPWGVYLIPAIIFMIVAYVRQKKINKNI